MSRSRLLAAMAIVAAPLIASGQATVADTGSDAPNFAAPGANMTGLIPSVSLAAYKGKTVVLAFFYKARTKG